MRSAATTNPKVFIATDRLAFMVTLSIALAPFGPALAIKCQPGNGMKPPIDSLNSLHCISLQNLGSRQREHRLQPYGLLAPMRVAGLSPGRPEAQEWDWDAGVYAVGLGRCEGAGRVHAARNTMMHPLHHFCSNVISDTRNSGKN